MSLRDDLAAVLAGDPRYSIQAYFFVFEALEQAKLAKKRARRKARTRIGATKGGSRHVSGRELCEGARALALAHYGMLAIPVLAAWGIARTSDIGAIVDNLVKSGDLERSTDDSPGDFEEIYEFETAFRLDFTLDLDDLT